MNGSILVGNRLQSQRTRTLFEVAIKRVSEELGRAKDDIAVNPDRHTVNVHVNVHHFRAQSVSGCQQSRRRKLRGCLPHAWGSSLCHSTVDDYLYHCASARTGLRKQIVERIFDVQIGMR